LYVWHCWPLLGESSPKREDAADVKAVMAVIAIQTGRLREVA